MRETRVPPASAQGRRDAFRDWLRNGRAAPKESGYATIFGDGRETLKMQLRSYEQARKLRAMSVNVNTSGGYLQHDNFEDSLEIALLWYDAFRPFATVDRVETGGATHHPTVNESNQIGIIVPENMQPGTADVVQFGDAVFRPQKFTSQFLLLPTGLEEDSKIDLDLWLGRLIGMRIGRIQSKTWTNGVLIPQATQAAAAASHTAIVYADVTALEYSIDFAYRQSPACGWMCNNAIRETLKNILSSTGAPIFQPRRTPAEVDMLDGYPVLYNPYLPSILAGGNQALFFGDWSRVHIRDVKEMRIVRVAERFAGTDQIAVCGLLRSDMVLMDAGTHPVQYLLQ